MCRTVPLSDADSALTPVTTPNETSPPGLLFKPPPPRSIVCLSVSYCTPFFLTVFCEKGTARTVFLRCSLKENDGGPVILLLRCPVRGWSRACACVTLAQTRFSTANHQKLVVSQRITGLLMYTGVVIPVEEDKLVVVCHHFPKSGSYIPLIPLPSL